MKGILLTLQTSIQVLLVALRANPIILKWEVCVAIVPDRAEWETTALQSEQYYATDQ